MADPTIAFGEAAATPGYSLNRRSRHRDDEAACGIAQAIERKSGSGSSNSSLPRCSKKAVFPRIFDFGVLMVIGWRIPAWIDAADRPNAVGDNATGARKADIVLPQVWVREKLFNRQNG